MTTATDPKITNPTRHSPGSTGYRRATAALFAAGMTTFMALYYVQALLPQISDHFAVGPATSTLSVSVTTGMLALTIIPASALSERYGRVRVMVGSAVAASLIGVALPWAPTIEVLLAGRALQGVLCAGVPAVAMAYLAEEVEGRSLGTAMGRYVAGTTIGGLVGRLIPGYAVDVVSWQWSLEIAALVSLAFAIAFWRYVPASQFFTPAPVSARITGRNLVAHLRDPSLWPLFVLAFVLMGGFVTTYNYIGYRLLDTPFDLPATVVASIFLIYLAGTVSSAWGGRLADRFGRRRILVVSVVMMLIGLLVTIPDHLWSVIIGMIAFTAGFFAAHAVAGAWVSARATQHRAEASSLYLFHYYLGSSVVGALGGIAFARFGWSGVVTFVGVLVAIGLLLTLRRAEAGAH